MLSVVISKLPILSITQEAPKTQQIPNPGVPPGANPTNSQLLSRDAHSSDLSQGHFRSQCPRSQLDHGLHSFPDALRERGAFALVLQ